MCINPPATIFYVHTHSMAVSLSFTITHQSSKSLARTGVLHTPHGLVRTPGFVAVATNGTLKSVDFARADAAGCELVFVNTAHFLVNSDPDWVASVGGLHGLLNRHNRPLITDSSGFQVFSWLKSNLVKQVTTQGGIVFKSYRDGRLVHVTPESSVLAQIKLGADIILVLDELLSNVASEEQTAASMLRSHEWALRGRDEFARRGDNAKQALYGIVHGGLFPELRAQSSALIGAQAEFGGFAIGGALGRARDARAVEALTAGLSALPRTKPVHLLGIGDVASIEAGAALGVDTFDSSFPTRAGRHFSALMADGALVHIRALKDASAPLMPECTCECCRQCSQAYLHHLFRTGSEQAMLAHFMCVHNLHVMHNVIMAGLRRRIERDEV